MSFRPKTRTELFPSAPKKPTVSNAFVLLNIIVIWFTSHISFSDKDATQLLHAYTFMKDLCDDSNLRNLVTAYPNFTTELKETLKVR